MPWRLLADPSGYIFTWLLGYSGGLGSIAGVLIADYWIVRKKKLALADLYREQGVYRTRRDGTGARSWPRWPAASSPGSASSSRRCTALYDYAWFVGFGVAFALHALLMKAMPPAVVVPMEA